MSDSTPPNAPESLDWKEVLEFVQKQQKTDRDHIQWIFGIALFVAAFFGFLGFQNLKSQVDSLVLAQFKDEQIRATMKKAADVAAAEMVKNALSTMVSEEVTKQRPLIASKLNAEVGTAIKDLQSSVSAAQKQVSGIANAIKDRRLSRAEKEQFAAALKHHDGFTVYVVTAQMDIEGKDFGSDLMDAFSLAGWKSSISASVAGVRGIVGSMPEGRFTDAACKSAMADISKALAALGYQIQWKPEPGQVKPVKVMMIRVGQRVLTPSGGGFLGTVGPIIP